MHIKLEYNYSDLLTKYWGIALCGNIFYDLYSIIQGIDQI